MRPEDKYLLVLGLQECGEVVAVSGEGTNDVPAIKRADIGYSMGIAGTDLIKQASDIIVLDDSFKSIINSILSQRAFS